MGKVEWKLISHVCAARCVTVIFSIWGKATSLDGARVPWGLMGKVKGHTVVKSKKRGAVQGTPSRRYTGLGSKEYQLA